MLTRIAMAALAITLLGASAFALAPLDPAAGEAKSWGSTVIEKNSAWPLKGQMTMDPCMVRTCLEA